MAKRFTATGCIALHRACLEASTPADVTCLPQRQLCLVILQCRPILKARSHLVRCADTRNILVRTSVNIEKATVSNMTLYIE